MQNKIVSFLYAYCLLFVICNFIQIHRLLRSNYGGMVALRIPRITELLPLEDMAVVRKAALKAGGYIQNVRFMKDTELDSAICTKNSAAKKALLVPREKLPLLVVQQLDDCKSSPFTCHNYNSQYYVPNIYIKLDLYIFISSDKPSERKRFGAGEQQYVCSHHIITAHT